MRKAKRLSRYCSASSRRRRPSPLERQDQEARDPEGEVLEGTEEELETQCLGPASEHVVVGAEAVGLRNPPQNHRGNPRQPSEDYHREAQELIGAAFSDELETIVDSGKDGDLG